MEETFFVVDVDGDDMVEGEEVHFFSSHVAGALVLLASFSLVFVESYFLCVERLHGWAIQV